jgi:hypothetical protein
MIIAKVCNQQFCSTVICVGVINSLSSKIPSGMTRGIFVFTFHPWQDLSIITGILRTETVYYQSHTPPSPAGTTLY